MHSARSIVSHCRQEGAYLRKGFLTYESGFSEIAFYLEPGSKRVPACCAKEAIASGRLVPRDHGLFDDDPDTHRPGSHQ